MTPRAVWVLAAALLLGPAAAAAQTAPGRTLVLPFENAGREPRVFWLGEGSSVLLTDDLTALGVAVHSREERHRAYDRLEVPAIAALSHATAIRLGQLLGAAQVIVGSFELSAGQLTVRARKMDLDPGRMGPEIAERGPLTELFAVYARVARRLVPDSRISLEQMEQGHPPLPAFEVYVKGLLAEAPATRTSFLSQAIQLAPGFQRARLALWEVHADLNEHSRALAVVRQVPAEHRLGRQARLLAAVSLLELSRHQEATEALTALQSATPDAAVLNNLAVVEMRRPVPRTGVTAVGLLDDARKRAPNDPDILFNLGYAYWLNRDVISATYWLREAVRRDPSDGAAHYVLGVALQAAGNTADALREKEAAKRLSTELAEWDTKQAGVNAAPRGLERLKTALQ
jgi:Flp pilus assembly protein TadD